MRPPVTLPVSHSWVRAVVGWIPEAMGRVDTALRFVLGLWRQSERMAQIGRVEVVCGPMFAGKTEELLRRVRRATDRRSAGRGVRACARHAAGRRSAGLARRAERCRRLRSASAEDIEPAVPDDTDVVAIDEAQFFGPGLVPVVGRLADRGLVVIVAGLDVTFDGRPFEPLPSLMALAERVDKLTAICSLCGEEAVFHVRLNATVSGSE